MSESHATWASVTEASGVSDAGSVNGTTGGGVADGGVADGGTFATSMLEPAEGLILAYPDEPVDIKRGLRDSALRGSDWRTGFSDEVCIGVWLWEQWRPALEPRGMARETFIDVVVGHGRELWLWLMGERAWNQFLPSLAGRVARRLAPWSPVE